MVSEFPSLFVARKIAADAAIDYEHTSGTPDKIRNALCIEVRSSQNVWTGKFNSAWEPTGLLTGYWNCPHPYGLLVVVSGDGFLLDVKQPHSIIELSTICPVVSVTPVIEHEILLLASFTELAAISKSGLEWTTNRLAYDDLRILKISGHIVHGSVPAYPPGHGDPVPFEVDLLTGETRGGCPPLE